MLLVLLRQGGQRPCLVTAGNDHCLGLCLDLALQPVLDGVKSSVILAVEALQLLTHGLDGGGCQSLLSHLGVEDVRDVRAAR